MLEGRIDAQFGSKLQASSFLKPDVHPDLVPFDKLVHNHSQRHGEQIEDPGKQGDVLGAARHQADNHVDNLNR